MSKVSTIKPQSSLGRFYLALVPSPPRSPPPSAMPSYNNEETDALEHERLVKSLLKQFKRLEFALGKFTLKLNGIMKTNMLRTVVLPFLRLLPPLEAIFDGSPSIYSSFVSVSITILGRWWRLLLSALSAPNPAQQVSATDRNAYLECISRILCRREWFLAGPEAMLTYTSCLCETLEYAVNKISTLKVIPVSMSAFVGKIFAYAFFFIPGFANALLFLLNVKQASIESYLNKMPPLSEGAIKSARFAFPSHLSGLVDYRGFPGLNSYKKKVFNCLPPPKHPVRGICDPNGPWVRCWSSCDSDMLNSFFRHYVNVSATFVENDLGIPLEAFPGIHVIMASFYQIFSICVSRILLDTASSGSIKKLSATKSAPNTSNTGTFSGTTVLKPMDINYAPLIKLFKTVRDIGYSEVIFSPEIVRCFDNILRNLAVSTSVYDFGRSATILNLICEYSNYVSDASDIDWEFWLGCTYLTLSHTDLIQSMIMGFAFLFNVWRIIPSQLPNSRGYESESNSTEWLTNFSESYKENFARWLSSNDTWLFYFTHWNPLVRSYYMRLISWRIVGFNNFDSSLSILTTRRIKAKVDAIHAFVNTTVKSSNLPEGFQHLDFSADLPMVNRKMGIVPVNPFKSSSDNIPSLASVTNTNKFSDLRKSHPYEILDEAVYTCNLLSNPSISDSKGGRSHKSSGNHSIISSFGKFFKLLSADDSDDSILSIAPPSIGGGPQNSIASGRKSKSFNSFLSGSFRMNSSSCSTAKSSQQSWNDSADSPATSDSETSSTISSYLGSSSASTLSSQTSMNKHPPELVKHTPDIIRPDNKFEIVLDKELMQRKMDQMLTANYRPGSKFFGSRICQGASLRTMPVEARIPSISIVPSSNRFHKFQITKEAYDCTESTSYDDEDLLSGYDLSIEATSSESLLAMGRSLNEWNRVVDEFDTFLVRSVELEQASNLAQSTEISGMLDDYNEEDYFKRLVPFMPIDNFIELKLLNAM